MALKLWNSEGMCAQVQITAAFSVKNLRVGSNIFPVEIGLYLLILFLCAQKEVKNPLLLPCLYPSAKYLFSYHICYVRDGHCIQAVGNLVTTEIIGSFCIVVNARAERTIECRCAHRKIPKCRGAWTENFN